MGNCIIGIVKYSDDLPEVQYSKIPTPLRLEVTSIEGVLLRLLFGRLIIEKTSYDRMKIKQNTNYTLLPYSANKRITKKAIDILLNADTSDTEIIEIVNRYLQKNRRNVFVHKHILFELSYYFFDKEISPVSAFSHLYRCFEFISYCFPMIYATKTKDYLGSFNNLKKFLSGNGGELGFCRQFILELFREEFHILAFRFDVPIISSNLEILIRECRSIFCDQFSYDFTENIFSIDYEDIVNLFITLRNRYFHMMIGQGQNNFISSEYEINDLFHALNPMFLNWLAIIIVEIIQHGVSSEFI